MPTTEQHSWVQNVLGVVGDIADSAASAVSDGAQAAASAVGGAERAVAGVVDDAVQAAGSAANSVGNFVDSAYSAASNAIGSAQHVVSAVVDDTVQAAAGAARAVGGFAEGAAAAASRAISGTEDAVVNAATSLVGGGSRPSNQPDVALQSPQTGQKPNQVLYGTETGDAGDIEDTDINQGQLGDCFLLSSIGEIARINPDMIKKMIKDNGDGTYTVTLYQREGGIWAGIRDTFTGHHEYSPVQVTVDGNFPNSKSVNAGATQDMVGGNKEIWVQILEKAYAKLNGGYAGIDDGGSPTDAMAALTGQDAKEESAGGFFGGISLQEMQDAFNAGKPIVMNTPDKATLPYNLVGDHAYMVEDIIVDASGKAQIKLRNPWGTTQNQPPQLIPFDKLSSGIDTVDIGGAIPKAQP